MTYKDLVELLNKLRGSRTGKAGPMEYSALPLNEVLAMQGPQFVGNAVMPTDLQTQLQPNAPEFVMPAGLPPSWKAMSEVRKRKEGGPREEDKLLAALQEAWQKTLSGPTAVYTSPGRINVVPPGQAAIGSSEQPVDYRSPLEVMGIPDWPPQSNAPLDFGVGPERQGHAPPPPIQMGFADQPMQPTYRDMPAQPPQLTLADQWRGIQQGGPQGHGGGTASMGNPTGAPPVQIGRPSLGNIKLDPEQMALIHAGQPTTKGNFSQAESTVHYDPSMDPGAGQGVTPEQWAQYQAQDIMRGLQSLSERAQYLGKDDPRYPTQEQFNGLSNALNGLLASQAQSQQARVLNTQEQLSNDLMGGKYKGLFDENSQLSPDVATGMRMRGAQIDPWNIQGGYDPRLMKIEDSRQKDIANMAARFLRDDLAATEQEAMDMADRMRRGALSPSEERKIWDKYPELRGESGTPMPSGGLTDAALVDRYGPGVTG